MMDSKSQCSPASLVLFGIGIAACGWLSGCSANIKMVPEVPTNRIDLQVLLRGNLLYDGKPDYLPRTIAEGTGNTINIRYTYDDIQARSPHTYRFMAVSPSLLFTEPVGSKAVQVVGSLEILDGESLMKTCSAIATLSISSEFSRETLSEMRRRGLFAVRDNVEAQMYQDREFLERLAVRKAQPNNR
jgi:hypothetical protein